MPAWGLYELFITGEYISPFPSLNVQEIDVIPSGTETPSTIIQTGGRGRKKASMTILVEQKQDYDNLFADYMASVQRVFTGYRDETMNAIISDLTPPDYISDGSMICRVAFLEA